MLGIDSRVDDTKPIAWSTSAVVTAGGAVELQGEHRGRMYACMESCANDGSSFPYEMPLTQSVDAFVVVETIGE